MAVPGNGATILVVYPELDIYATILGYSDVSSERYVTSASMGNEVVAALENGATLLVYARSWTAISWPKCKRCFEGIESIQQG